MKLYDSEGGGGGGLGQLMGWYVIERTLEL